MCPVRHLRTPCVFGARALLRLPVLRAVYPPGHCRVRFVSGFTTKGKLEAKHHGADWNLEIKGDRSHWYEVDLRSGRRRRGCHSGRGSGRARTRSRSRGSRGGHNTPSCTTPAGCPASSRRRTPTTGTACSTPKDEASKVSWHPGSTAVRGLLDGQPWTQTSPVHRGLCWQIHVGYNPSVYDDPSGASSTASRRSTRTRLWEQPPQRRARSG